MFDLKQQIYRYVPYETFLEMICLQRIVAVSPANWPDEYELYGLRKLESEDGLKALKDFVASKKLSECEDDTVKRVVTLFKICYCRTYAICFSEEPDSEPLWRAYSGKTNPIMFATIGEELMKLTGKKGFQDSFLEQVEYDLLEGCTFQDYLSSITVDKGTAMMFDTEQLFRHKREKYSYEKEVRFLLNLPGTVNLSEKSGAVYLPIPDLASFIKGVMASPQAPKYQVEAVRAICQRYGIPFLGSSTVYKMQ